MIPEDSILRTLPGVVSAEERWRLEALVVALDQIDVAHTSLCEILLRYGKPAGGLTRPDQAAIFLCAWSIVDRVYAIGAVLSWAKTAGLLIDIASFERCSEAARFLRNKMDHFDGNAKNLASQKKVIYPPFGVISYFIMDDSDLREGPMGREITGGMTVTVYAGSIYGEAEMPMANPLGDLVDYPLSHIFLSAYSHRFDISQTVRILRSLAVELSATVEVALHSKLSAIAARTGQTMAALKGGPISGIVATAVLTVSDETIASRDLPEAPAARRGE
ncbi:MAG: hypothetical protein KA105_09125 [Caulobacter sp.]|nr:hypothetical protein [Caulobacter sp.]